MQELAQTTLDKLSGIRNDLIGNDDTFDNWNYEQLIAALKLWIKKNPVQDTERDYHSRGREFSKPPPKKVFHTREKSNRDCVYSNSTEHRSVDCTVIGTPAERRSALIQIVHAATTGQVLAQALQGAKNAIKSTKPLNLEN